MKHVLLKHMPNNMFLLILIIGVNRFMLLIGRKRCNDGTWCHIDAICRTVNNLTICEVCIDFTYLFTETE